MSKPSGTSTDPSCSKDCHFISPYILLGERASFMANIMRPMKVTEVAILTFYTL